METSIKSFEDACKALSRSTEVPDEAKFGKAAVAHYKLVTIAEALNEGWKPNWQNRSEWKHYPWFDMEKDENNPSGFRFYDTRYGNASSDVGSRLCFKSEELAIYAGNEFKALYRDMMVIE